MHPKVLEKQEQTAPKKSKQEEIIKVTVEIEVKKNNNKEKVKFRSVLLKLQPVLASL